MKPQGRPWKLRAAASALFISLALVALALASSSEGAVRPPHANIVYTQFWLEWSVGMQVAYPEGHTLTRRVDIECWATARAKNWICNGIWPYHLNGAPFLVARWKNLVIFLFPGRSP